MSAHITDTEWMAYLENEAGAEARARLEEHAGACPACRQIWDATEAAGAVLGCGAALREAIPVSEAEIRHNLARLLERAALAGHEELWEGGERERRLRRIRTLLAPLCGAEGVQRMIEAAARRAGAASGSQLPATAWPEFARHFAVVAARLCGDSLGLLAFEHAAV